MSNASILGTSSTSIVAIKDTAIIGGLLAVLAVAFAASSTWNTKGASKGIPTLRGPPIFGHWRFFSDRYAFINDGLKKLGSAFQFTVLNHTVLVVSGEQARTDFLNSSTLSFREGYKVLFGVTPSVRHVKANFDSFESSEASWFAKRVVSILRRDRLQRMIPRIFDDIRAGMKPWGISGQFDPLEDIYDVVFQLTVRASSSTELANDPVAVKKLKHCLHDCEKASSPASLLVSWLPSKDRKQRQKSSKEMYQMFKKVLDERKAMGHREDDPTQVLIDEGNTDNDIVEFSMIALFAGVANTGIMAAWVLMYLATDPVWKAKVGDEVQNFITKYAPGFETADSDDQIDNLAAQLSKIPSIVWEEEMELTDLCLRETIRMAQSSVFLRRNISPEEVKVGGASLASGEFVAYPSADVHHNPTVYEDPSRFDPMRHVPKEKAPPFVGWGAGRHPCLGMRFAKLEVKWIVAMFLAAYDYEVVNEAGKVVRTLPEPNHNNIFDRTKRPEGETLYIKYHRKTA